MKICSRRRGKSERLEKRINGKLEEVFKAEDARIQSVVKRITETIDIEEPEEVKEVSKEGETNPPQESEVFALEPL